MRELVNEFLNRGLSRRGFLRRLVESGFSAAAAASILESLAPLARAESASGAETAPAPARVVEGTGGELLVEQLHAAGVRFVFNCNSSGTYAIFDALVDRPDMQVIQVPQEGQMIAIAQGYVLASGQTAFTVNGSVGFPNTLNNMYNAWKDRSPIVVASQREATGIHGGRDAFEEWDDYLSPSASFTRWRWSIDQTERIPEITRRAFKIAVTPPEGPVALALPIDVLTSRRARAEIVERDKFIIQPRVKADPRQVEEAARLLVAAKSPLLLVGPEVTRSRAHAEVVKLAELLSLPVAQAERLSDDFPTDHPLFLGDYVGPWRYPGSIDLVLNLGAKMPYPDGMVPPDARVIHASIDPDLIGRVVSTDVGLVADVKETAADLTTAMRSMLTRARLREIASARLEVVGGYTHKSRDRRERFAHLRWDDLPLSWERVAGELSGLLERDAIIVPELGEGTWLGEGSGALEQFTFKPGGMTKIGRTTGSALGWGVGAAIGVKLAQPDRQVVALQGDGGFLFAQAETLWTMARYQVPIIVVIFNNRSYNGPRNKIWAARGTQAVKGRDMTCYLGDPDVDFAQVAAGFGVQGEIVTAPDQVQPAVRRAIASTREGRPYLIDAVVRRTGAAANSVWHPRYSVATARTRKV